MTRRLVRKWKVTSAAWAGMTAALVAAPLAYMLLRSDDDRSGPLPGQVRTNQLAEKTTAPQPPAASAEPLAPPRPAEDLAFLERAARSKEGSALDRAQAVARIGHVREPEALELLETLAREGREGEEPNLVALAAMNGLWARGERDLVREIAARSADPAVKSKALALARARSR